MTVDSSNIGVAGTDGIVPVYDPSARWCMWAKNEIWTGSTGTNKYIPKVSDYVIDPSTFETWIVTAIDEVTLIPELQVIRPANMSYSFTETDVLFGVGASTPSDIYRVYIDKSTHPYTLSVDTHLQVGGSMTTYAKIYKGSIVDATAEVVSKVYDNSGNYISDKVPLELAALNSHENISIKVVKPCKTLHDLTDGEIVTVVLYNDAGGVVSKRQLYVENTSFIRSVNDAVKYITAISLESPFLSGTNDHEIAFPLNVPLSALNMTGVVHYSDGTKVKLAVDGTKFKMYGLDQYLSTIVDQKIDLVLAYCLSDEEVVYGAVTSDGKYITEAYSIRSVDVNNSYTVKVYGYPSWVDSSNGYTMKWFMTNLDRNLFYDVTDQVEFAENTGAFNPKGYGYSQQKAITLNLKNVSSGFKAFVHTQLVEIVLKRAPVDRLTPWTVSHEYISTRDSYGDGCFAIRQSLSGKTIQLGVDIASEEDWLNTFYYNYYPLTDSTVETTVPVPTHFEVFQGCNKISYTIDNWNKVLTLPWEATKYSTLFIRFYRSIANATVELGVSACTVTD